MSGSSAVAEYNSPAPFSLATGNSKTGILKEVSELPVKC